MKSTQSAAHTLALVLGFSALLAASATFAKDPPQSIAPGKEREMLLKGKALIGKGAAQQAITEFFDPVIDGYAATYKGSGKRVYSAQNPIMAILYVALPDENQVGTEVVDGAWADAYLLKAYALTELGKTQEAQEALNSAIALSPMNSQYLSELAYTYQRMKDCDKSIATYEEAASMAELGSDDATKTADLTRAWRGKGYCLVEQGKLKEAQETYTKSIALDPKDDKSKGELNYIRSLKK